MKVQPRRQTHKAFDTVASELYFLLTSNCSAIKLHVCEVFGKASLTAQRNVYMFFPDPSVWVSDSQQPFVKVQKESPDVVYMREGQDLVFPCRVTDPDTKVSLIKVSTFKQTSKILPKLTSGRVICC